jgi:hypothetical protein
MVADIMSKEFEGGPDSSVLQTILHSPKREKALKEI